MAGRAAGEQGRLRTHRRDTKGTVGHGPKRERPRRLPLFRLLHLRPPGGCLRRVDERQPNPRLPYGLAAHPTWEADAAITAVYGSHTRLASHVLCARPGERLSYLLQAGPTAPPAYLTWLIRPNPSACTITLVADELDTRDTTEDVEDTWLPVLAALRRHLTKAD